MSLRRPTKKQKNFVKEYINNGQNATKAIMAAYDVKDEESAHAMTTPVRNNPTVMKLIDEALEEENLNEHSIARGIAEGLQAQKIAYDRETNSYYLTGLPDYAERGKSVDRLTKLLGANAAEKKQISVTGVLGIEDLNRIRKRLETQVEVIREN